jgi:hypothetical protein
MVRSPGEQSTSVTHNLRAISLTGISPSACFHNAICLSVNLLFFIENLHFSKYLENGFFRVLFGSEFEGHVI